MATGQRTVSTAFLLHQSENSSHLFSYCALVDGALAFRMVFLTVAVQNLSGGSGPAVAKPRAGGGGGLGAKSDPQVVIGGPSCRGGAMESCNRAWESCSRGLVTSVQENQRGQWANSSEAKRTPYPLHHLRVKPPLARWGLLEGSPQPDSGPMDEGCPHAGQAGKCPGQQAPSYPEKPCGPSAPLVIDLGNSGLVVRSDQHVLAF